MKQSNSTMCSTLHCPIKLEQLGMHEIALLTQQKIEKHDHIN